MADGWESPIIDLVIGGFGLSDLLSFAEVCRKFGKHRLTIESHLGKKLPSGKEFKPEVRSGNRRYFTKEVVEEFGNTFYEGGGGLTLQEISEMYGVPKGTVYDHFRRYREIEPDGKKGYQHAFSMEKVRMIANAAGWVTKDPQSSTVHRENEEVS